MDSIQAQASRDAHKESVLTQLINKGKESYEWGDSNKPVEDWFRYLQTKSRILQLGESMAGPHSGPDWQCENLFSQYARVLYTIRMILPTHPDYQVFTADPLIRNQVDTVFTELFERLKVLKREVLERGPIRDANQILEDEEAWNVFIRDLQFEDEETVVNEDIHSPPEGSNLEDLPLESSSVHQAIESTTSQSVHGTIPDEPPSPRSYWIDLHPIEDAGYGHISEVPPVPLSHWIDLRPIDDCKDLIPEFVPEPASMFLDLHPLEDSSVFEVPPSPAEFTLDLHELHDE